MKTKPINKTCKFYNLVEKVHYFVKTKYVLWIIYHKYCALFIIHFVELCVRLFYMRFCCIFHKFFSACKIKLKLWSLEFDFASKNKELLSHYKVYRKMQQVEKQPARWSDGSLVISIFFNIILQFLTYSSWLLVFLLKFLSWSLCFKVLFYIFIFYFFPLVFLTSLNSLNFMVHRLVVSLRSYKITSICLGFFIFLFFFHKYSPFIDNSGRGGYLFNNFLPLAPTSQTLRH